MTRPDQRVTPASVIHHIWVCECGATTRCSVEDTLPASVFRCRKCRQVWGRVRPRNGSTVLSMRAT